MSRSLNNRLYKQDADVLQMLVQIHKVVRHNVRAAPSAWNGPA